MRIVICDDHPLLVQALAAELARAGHVVEALASTPAGAVRAVECHRPDVLLLDLSFPDGDSLRTARELVARHPQTRIVVLTGSHDLRQLEQALSIGVAGYARKDQRIEEMLPMLERCARGEQVIDDVLTRRLASPVHGHPAHAPGSDSLTARERDVAGLLQEGCSTIEVATRLGISDSTVRTHVRAVLNKLGVHSRTQAVALLDGRDPRARPAAS